MVCGMKASEPIRGQQVVHGGGGGAVRQVQLGALDLLQQQPVHLLAQLPHLQTQKLSDSQAKIRFYDALNDNGTRESSRPAHQLA